MTLIVLIGGHPKGHKVPFSEKTLSGKRLRAMVTELGISGTYLDLWKTAEEEKKGDVRWELLTILHISHHNGFILVALGKTVQKALEPYRATFPIVPLPHPASRRKKDLDELKEGLRALK